MATIPPGTVVGSGAASGAGGDALRRNFQDLRNRSPDIRANAAKSIRQYLELEAQERSGEGFAQVLDSLQKRIATEYGVSLDSSEKLGFILLIDELVVLAAENGKMQLWLMSQLSSIIKDQIVKGSPSEIDVLGAATRALGHFARSGSPRLTYVLLDGEKKSAIVRMKNDRGEMSRHASMMIITELSGNAPALFLNQDLKTFFENIWDILCDPKIQVRVRAALAVRNMLVLESNRHADTGVKDDQQQHSSTRQLHSPLYKYARSAFPPPLGDWTNKKKGKANANTVAAQLPNKVRSSADLTSARADPFHAIHRENLSPPPLTADPISLAPGNAESNDPKRLGEPTYDYNNIPVIHAALLTFYELLAMDEMQSSFLDMLHCVWRDEVRFHKDSLILHHVIALLPRMARYCESEMMPKYLAEVVNYLLDIIKASRESSGRLMDRAMAFRALGQLAIEPKVSNSNYFTPHFSSVMGVIRTAIDTTKDKRNPFSEEALECLEMLVRSQKTLSEDAKIEISQIHGLLYGGSLSEPLVATLNTIGKAYPALLNPIRKRLLAEITLVLGAAGNSLTATRIGNIVGDGMTGAGGGAGGEALGRTPTNQKKSRWMFFSSSGSSASATPGSSSRDRVLFKTLEQRLGLFSQSADPYLVAMLQGVIDGSPPHPAATAVAEATSSINLKTAFALRRGGPKDDSSAGQVSMQELDTYRQRLALRTLGSFDFAGVTVLPLVMAAVVQFLESTNVGVRLEAVVACCRLLSSAATVSFSSRRKMDNRSFTAAGVTPSKKGSTMFTGQVPSSDPAEAVLADYRTAADYVVERLVVMALTDADPDVRCRVVEELDSPKFRAMLLENPENLRSLFVLVNDQHFGVRAAAVVAIGHLAEKAPGYIVPAMRTVLVRLLTELDFGGDIRHREESAALLGLLVKSLDAPFARPHVDSMLKGLLPKLQDANPGASSAVMAALGEVAIVARDSLLPHVGKILNVVMETMDERSTHGFMEREVALSTLSKVCKSTIMSIWPYFYQRRLLDLILQVMVSSSSPWPVRRQAMIALGTLGALDPWLHKKNQRESLTLQALGDEFASAWLMANSLESPEFAAQRYSLASPVFDFAFGGGGYNSDEDDEFEAEYVEDVLEAPVEEDKLGHRGGNTPTKMTMMTQQSNNGMMMMVDRHHWKLASRTAASMDPFDDSMDDLGADLDVVFKAPQPATLFETGKHGSMISGLVRTSGGVVVKAPSTMRGMDAIISEEGEGEGPATQRSTNLKQRARRGSVQLTAAAIAPASTTQTSSNVVAGRALSNQGHGRRLSIHLTMAAVQQQHMNQSSMDMGVGSLGPSDTALGEAQAGSSKDDKSKGQADSSRMQRLRALAAGARVGGVGADDLGVFGLDPSTILPSMVPDHYDATVCVTALVRVLNDPTAASKRKEESMSTVVKILTVLGDRKKEAIKPFLPHVVPAMLRIAKAQLALVNVPVEQRSWPLAKIGELVGIAQRDYRAYLPQTFELTRPYYGDHTVLTDILDLALAVARNLEAKSLQLYIPNLLPELLGILRAERENPNLNWVNTPAVLGTISTLGAALGDYLYLVLPMLMRLVDQTLASSGMIPLVIRVRAVDTLNELVKRCDVADYASRLLHPLCRSLSECHLETTKSTSSSPRNRKSGLGHSERDYNARILFVSLLSVLTNLVFRLEEEFAVFIPMVEEALQHTMSEAAALGNKNPLQLVPSDLEAVEYYRQLVQRVLRGHALPKPNWYNAETEDNTAMDVEGSEAVEATKKKSEDATSSFSSVELSRKEIKYEVLKERIGDPTQRTTDEDWIEWMRRFSIGLLECSPSYALEACYSLAQIHEPLAQDLFNAAFASVWGELGRNSVNEDAKKREMRLAAKKSLIDSLKQALTKAVPPKDILQTLLNLAEFMEHDDKPLPLDMKRLGELAFSTQAFAKSLRYREIAFRISTSSDKTASWDVVGEQMAEGLIEVNKNLDQINAAHGIVEYLKRNNAQQEQQPSWYAQLGIWEKALEAYRNRYERLRMSHFATVTADGAVNGLVLEEMNVNQGRMQCLKALGEWDKLAELSEEKRNEIREMARLARKTTPGTKDTNGAANHDTEDFFLGIRSDFAFGRDIPENDADGKATSPSAALTTTYMFDRLQGFGDRFRPVSVLLKNSNRGAMSNDRQTMFSVGGPSQGGDLSKGASSVVAVTSTSDAAAARRVSYLEPRGASPAPRRTQSGVQLNEAMTRSSSRAMLVDANGTPVIGERYLGKKLDEYERENSEIRRYYEEINKLGAYASWMLRRWSTMKTYVYATSENSYDGNFLRAVLDVEMDSLNAAEARVEAAYRRLGQEVTSNFGETYSRAYSRIVRVQELAELQELISYKRLVKRTKGEGRQDEARREFSSLKKLWRQRLQGVQQNVDVLLPILAVRSMVVEPKEDIDTWLNFAKVARKQGRKLLSLKALMNLGIGASSRRPNDDEEVVHDYDDPSDDEDDLTHRRRSSAPGSAMAQLAMLHEDDANLDPYPTPLFPSRHPPGEGKVHPRVVFAYINHLWTVGEQEEKMSKQREAVLRLKRLAKALNDCLAPNMGQGPMEYVGNISFLSSPTAQSNHNATSLPEAQVLGGLNSTARKRSQPRGKSKLSVMSRPGQTDMETRLAMEEDLVRSLRQSNLGEDQLSRLAIRCNCQLGEWIKALNSPATESSPSRSASIARDADSLASYTSKGVLQNSQRTRGMTVTLSFFGTPPTQQGDSSQWTKDESRKFNDVIHEALGYYETAIRLDNTSYRGWRLWALTNDEAVRINHHLEVDNPGRIVCAISGLLRSIQLGSEEFKTSVLQDTLRLLQLWFKYESIPVVAQALSKRMFDIPKSTWLEVIPQLIARVSRPTDLVCELLTKIGLEHPQQLLFPLTVASDRQRTGSEAAQKIMKTLEESYPVLVEQARLVSKELIRVAVLWPEMWHEGLEEASQLFFSANRNIDQMIDTLEQLHKRMEDPGPETLSEVGFAHAFGRDLKEAGEWLRAYADSTKDDLSYLNQAWDLYYKVFKVISKQLDVKSLELRRVSPQLLHASSLELAVPGRYVDALGDCIYIEKFIPTLRVIKSKQRPRVITMKGSDGADHMFLLKGHEDLRLDERVMQLLGLVNNLLAADGETHRSDVEIQKYAVVPLSSRAGVMQWVPHCDTLHELIREYRDARRIPVNVEHRVINDFAPQFETLMAVQKVEVFEHAISETSGQDLAKVLWLKSANSETWLDRRTNFTRSLAAMSIVGYVLGLGDRHPSNLMCERASGRILHIDFGDCFEVAMHRIKFPEAVPFRLTRMLVNAMEVSGVEGNYRITCQNVMRVLRANRDSVMTMLEAFVHDPLITWRLFQPKGRPSAAGTETKPPETNKDNDSDSSPRRMVGIGQGVSKQDLPSESNIGSVMEYGYTSLATNVTTNNKRENDKTVEEKNNQRGWEVVERVRDKLHGKDFDKDLQLDENDQVDRLIRQAQAHENLAVMYTGWSPVW